MRLSQLQKSILITCLERRAARSGRGLFYEFYKKIKKPPKHNNQVNATTKALERLIDREFLIGYGVRTSHKWYIKEVRLTPKGKKLARIMLGEQQFLPFKKIRLKT